MKQLVVGCIKSERVDIIKQVRNKPECYLDLDERHRADPEICMATLMSPRFDFWDINLYAAILQMVFRHVPNFNDHREAFLQLVKKDNNNCIAKEYLSRFGPELYCHHKDIVTEAIKLSKCVWFFPSLPLDFRSDPEMIQLATEHRWCPLALEVIIAAVPKEILAEHDWVLLRALEGGAKLKADDLPVAVWHNRNFLLAWTKRRNKVPIQHVPKEFSYDRDFCRSLLCRTQWHRSYVDEILRWIPFATEKNFLFECLCISPKLFPFYEKEIQSDFEFVLAGADFTAGCNESSYKQKLKFSTFRNNHLPGDSFVEFAKQVHCQLQSHNEFMALCACLWKSRQISIQPLIILGLDKETTRGLKTMMAQYIGSTTVTREGRLSRVWKEIVTDVLFDTSSAALMPYISAQDVVKCVLDSVAWNGLPLKEYPEELWTHRKFVLWAAKKGMFDQAIPKSFSEDMDICLAYYSQDISVREMIMPWISETLKADREFVLKCASCDPLILVHCSDEIRYDYSVMLNATYRARLKRQVENLVETALSGGWADALIFFAKKVRYKMEVQSAFESFQAQSERFEYSSDYATLFSADVVMQLIGNYLGIPTDDERDKLRDILRSASMFYLTVGGSVEDLCQANKFVPMWKK